jgi:uncharacterized repeat protein (TIGR01451 family)
MLGASAVPCRRHFSRIGRLVCGVAAVLGLMAALPAVASAALSITGVSLSRTSGPPGSVMIGGINSSPISYSTVTVSRSGSVLRSIRYYYGANVNNGECLDNVSTSTSTTTSQTVNVRPALPRTPGSYTISFQAFNTNGCTGTSSNVASGGTVTATTPTANPVKELRCGLSVALVLDESLSINADDVVKTREAAKAFVGALDDTGASVAVVAFAQRSRVLVPYTEVTGTTIASTFNPGLNNFANITSTARSGTNWQSAFNEVSTGLNGLPDLVVFMTDGDPNGTNATTSFTTTLDGGVDVMTPAVAAANAVKEPSPGVTGSRVFAIGVGAAVSSAASVSRLTAVSGPREGSDVEHSDYTLLDHFAALETSLKAIVAGLCGGSLSITKTDYGPDGQPVEASGWTFTATLTPPPSHEWLVPTVSPGSRPSASVTTGSDGEAVFHWKLTGPGDATLSVVTEQVKPGFHLVLAECHVTNSDGDVTQTESRTTEPIGEGLVVPPKGHAACAVENARTVAHLTVVKRLVPTDDTGRFDLLVNGEPVLERVGNGEIRLTRPLGTYEVSEQVSAGQAITLADYTITTKCVNNGAAAGQSTDNTPVEVTLNSADDNIVCTITNTRVAGPPGEGGEDEGVIPVPPCNDIDDDIPQCGDVAAAPHLMVTKRMPAHARVGDRVPITITVRNVGHATAHEVRLHETPPPGGRIVAAANHGSIQSDGTVVWNLGNLAPGESRTVHATMLVTRPGLHTDTAVASAGNADPAFDAAAVRARGAAPAPPPPVVTG